MNRLKRKNLYLKFVLIIALVLLLFLFLTKTLSYTNTNAFCNICHFHPEAYTSWQKSVHYTNKTNKKVNCVECHLPPKGEGFYKEKIYIGARDFYGFLFKNKDSIDWREKRKPKNAAKYVYQSSCLKCHTELFPANLSAKGGEAHLKTVNSRGKLHCVACHIDVGHGRQKENIFVSYVKDQKQIYKKSTEIKEFVSYEEKIPGSSISFGMQAIPGGVFYMKKGKNKVKVRLSCFFMGRTEVTWDEYAVFMRETESEGRNQEKDIDAITGATPPWGDPAQGWGMGKRPAITITHHAATVYCKWLSEKTGKIYRLPTEAEWEYACFAGLNKECWYKDENNQLPENFMSYVNCKESGNGKTTEPKNMKPNPFGLINMLGNVKEFCTDKYDIISYFDSKEELENPLWNSGSEYVIKGGSFKSSVKDIRVSLREMSNREMWLRSDPQIPKSIWWYSDCNDVGFRVVCENPLNN